MKLIATYTQVDSEGNEFSFELNAIRCNGNLYISHYSNGPWFVADGIAAPDQLREVPES